MTAMLKVLVIFVLLGLVQPKSVSKLNRTSRCYDDLGCFDTSSPFFSSHRLVNFVPESPSFINPSFTLFTQQNVNNGEALDYSDVRSLMASSFSDSRPTKIIVHGFLKSGDAKWMKRMKDEFLNRNDVNVIIVGWGKGALPPYPQATANARVVGAMIAHLIKTIQNSTNATPESFHIIGHSLGAHVAGYAGERLQHLGRITGLDPARPFFEHTDIRVRLDPSDALFVDVIHTDGQNLLRLGFGMKQACGHADFYPNGGISQPGCEQDPISTIEKIESKGLVKGIESFVSCNHMRAHVLFTESINSQCAFQAYQCNSYDDFENGKCIPCSGKACGYMGFHADKVKPPSAQTHVKYFLKTGGDAPFCRYHYKVLLTFDGKSSKRGLMFVNIIGKSGETGELTLNEIFIEIQPKKSYSFVVTSPKDVGDIVSIDFRWHHLSSWIINLFDWIFFHFHHPKVYLNKVQIVSGHTGSQFTLCGHSAGIETGHKDRLSTSHHSC